MKPFHIALLESELNQRKQKNSRYSLRAFANHLKIDPSALSRILSGKQELSVQSALQLLEKLQFAEEQRQRFIHSIAEEKFKHTLSGLGLLGAIPASTCDIPQHVVILKVELDGSLKTLFMNRCRLDYAGPSKDGGFIIHPDELDKALTQLRTHFRDGTNYVGKMRLRRHDGEYRWFLVTGAPVASDPGRWVFISTDIHEQELVHE